MKRAGKKKVMSRETIQIYNETEKTLTIEQQSSVKSAARNAGFTEANVTMIETEAVPGTMIVFTDETGKKEKTLLL